MIFYRSVCLVVAQRRAKKKKKKKKDCESAIGRMSPFIGMLKDSGYYQMVLARISPKGKQQSCSTTERLAASEPLQSVCGSEQRRHQFQLHRPIYINFCKLVRGGGGVSYDAHSHIFMGPLVQLASRRASASDEASQPQLDAVAQLNVKRVCRRGVCVCTQRKIV